MIEQEVKLEFENAEAARQAVMTAGGRLIASRRLIDDCLFDTADTRLRKAGTTLRLRHDGDRGFVTFKGPIRPGPVKAREELETSVASLATMELVLASLGLHPAFRSQKFREEFALGPATVAIDETPMGVFVEIEATPDEIARASTALGRTTEDYRLESYSAIWARWCAEQGIAVRDMLFDDQVLPR
jgi:adenylate cyclase class 2